MKTINIEKGSLYDYRELLEDGYKFARLEVNRELDSKHVNKMKDSMETLNGAIMPFIVITAKEALEQSWKVILDDGTVVTTKSGDIDKILVIIEGQHRSEALKRLYAEGKKTISASIMLPLVETKDIVKLLQEVNTSVTPWDGIDWLTSLHAIAKEKNIPMEATALVKELSADSNISDSSAWLWAKGSIISKAKIVREIKNGDVEQIKKIVHDPSIKERRTLYTQSKAKLGEKLVGLKKIPTLLCDYEQQLIDNGIPRPESWEKVIKFVSELNTATVKNLKEAKKSKTQTKDQVLTNMLNIVWKEYMNSLALPNRK